MNKKKNILGKRGIGLTLAIALVVFTVIAVSAANYPRRMKKMFLSSSAEAMQEKLNAAAAFTNENVKVNYEEIRLLSGLLSEYLENGADDSETVLSIMSHTREQAGFTHIGILPMDSRRLLATMSDGSKVQLDVWATSDIREDEVMVDLQTSPFRTADEGKDAVIYRYLFRAAGGGEYLLVAEKPQETLNSILNVDKDVRGLTLVMRDNGNVVYSSGRIASEEVISYNFLAYIKSLGGSDDKAAEIEKQIREQVAGEFQMSVENEEYYFVFHRIENTNWICVNGYAESVMVGENLDLVNNATMRLVLIVTALLVLALILVMCVLISRLKEEQQQKTVERERLFEEMSRYIPSAFAIVREGSEEPSFRSHNFNAILHQDSFDFSLEGVLKWAGIPVTDDTMRKFREEKHLQTTVSQLEKYFSCGIYDIGVIDQERYYVYVLADVTQEVNSRNLLEDSISRADEASRSKTQFLSKMSHEIRTPLNSVLGFSRLALDEWDESDKDELKDYMKKIQISGSYLLELVSDILDISRIEEGRLEINNSPYRLGALVDEVRDAFQGQMERKNIDFEMIDDFDDVTLMMDAFHLKQILNNLISNACKYTEEGGQVIFTILTNKLDARRMGVQFSVKDSGIGMTPEFLEKIFEPFTQEDRGVQMKKQLRGSGLGMSICKNLVELQSGTIKVLSEVGKGSEFIVQMTFDIAEKKRTGRTAPITADDNGGFEGKKILVVDDLEMNRIIVEKFLKKHGFTFVDAENGAEAVQRFEKSAEGEYFAIFMDVQMPVMTGYEATEAIRKLPRSDAKTVAILGMTADAFSDDVNKAMMSGMNYHVTKPIDPDRIMAHLREIKEGEKK